MKRVLEAPIKHVPIIHVPGHGFGTPRSRRLHPQKVRSACPMMTMFPDIVKGVIRFSILECNIFHLFRKSNFESLPSLIIYICGSPPHIHGSPHQASWVGPSPRGNAPQPALVPRWLWRWLLRGAPDRPQCVARAFLPASASHSHPCR